MSQLRSLHIPNLADHVIINHEPKELVMQMTDIITLRPEIQLCYVGVSNKCFEILENRPSTSSTSHLSSHHGATTNHHNSANNAVHGGDGSGTSHHAPVVVEDAATDEDDTEEEDDHDEDDDEDDDSQDEGTPTSPTEPDDGQSENSYDGSDGDSFVEPAPATRLRLREILFYDDKVGIFKARHARL